ncbi:hypothetical protein PALU110988_16920 [Paenibacillus lupini]|uniref:hypothetical protein n=1 Tax=Paenibacillus lupini TaxID=1450204 RepID=UPI001424949E|nr:hypothetical protein [Paenibacillus lupini]NIK24540.1 hypothetical protein [Paenibacillus lupini]
MMDKLNKLSRHLAIPFFLVALLLIGVIVFLNHTHQNAGTLYVKDHSGDRSAIDPIIISGDISDQYASTSFEISKGQLNRHTEVSDPPALITDHYKYIQGWKKRMDGLDYQVEGGYTYSVTYIGGRKSSLINTGLVFQSENIYSNSLERGLAKIGDHVYFTVPTSAETTGTNGIYEPSFEEDGTTRTVAEYSLDQNKDGGSLEVWGLEAVGDKLALILIENGHPIVQGYDPDSGQLLGNIMLDQTGIKYSGQYEAFNNDQILNLVFQKKSVTDFNIRAHKAVWSIDFNSGMKVIDKTNLDYETNGQDNFRSRMTMHYQGGQLYVVYTSTEPRPNDQYYADSYLPIHLLIRVYKDDQLLYEGEIDSDLNDDFINTTNIPYGQSFDINSDDYRMFDHLKIQAREEE